MEKDLSEKTREIMDLLAAGLSEVAAARLYLSISTVSYHVRQARDFFQIERPSTDRDRVAKGVEVLGEVGGGSSLFWMRANPDGVSDH